MLSEVAQKPPLREQGKKKNNKKRQYVIHRTCHLLYCMSRQAMHLHERTTTLSAELAFSPPPPSLLSDTNRSNEITERQTALAHSVCRVYMTMLK